MTFVPGVKRVMMVHPNLQETPHYALPDSYRIRWYRPGDEAIWLAIKTRSDMYHLSDHSFFAQTYGQQYDLLPGRQAYLYDANDHAVGTLTAWFETLGEKQFGKINWMLLVPEAQGKGLSKPLLSVICRRLLELGHQKALLYTLTARVPAVNLYRLFGFVPLIRSEQDYQAWVEANPQLRRPFSVNEFIELKAFLE